ncbi:DUF6318 family protein [Kribbella lupini]|uniref:DUF6318 domain-containing protein n=1 Tax=Kribbella lupini TaxID=291602 RepID=A0ABP4LVZ8_9ACTN
MTFRNNLTASIAACLLTTALAACSNSSPEAGRPETGPPPSTGSPDRPSSATPSASATAPSKPPSRPTPASGASLAAGEAFIAYYVSLLNYSYATGDPKPFMAESDQGCLGCKALAGYVQKVNAQNGGLTGDYVDKLQAVKEIYRGEAGKLGGSATLKSGDFVERASPSASPVPKKSATGTMEFTLSPSGGNWVMFEMQIT